ncbi:MAG TPA: hypothetical protein PKC20_01515 [Burkholderiaceae bacterium]|nr:hypothetical protein [Burkholderiaceae bacterium]
MAQAPSASRFSLTRFLVTLLLIVLAIGALYFAVVLNWSYSSGERAGWVQKFSRKGWLCKTWEGEVALVSMPGAIPEKFEFTVTDDAVADQINRLMGHRVSLHYEQKVGLPTTCFGETRYYVTRVLRVEDGTGGPGSTAPGRPGAPGTPGVVPGGPGSSGGMPPATPSAPSAPSAPSTPPAPSPPSAPGASSAPSTPPASTVPAAPNAPGSGDPPATVPGLPAPGTRP